MAPATLRGVNISLYYFLCVPLYSTVAILIILLAALRSCFTFGEGIPAVRTTTSPIYTYCFTFASSIAPSQISSVVSNSLDLIGTTPQ